MLDLHLLGAMEISITMPQGIDMFLLLKTHIFHLCLIYIQNIEQITILLNSYNHSRFIVSAKLLKKKHAELSDLVL